jgi:hypothetical protein
MRFEENLGQTDSQVRFVSHGHGYSLFLTPTEAVFALHARKPQQPAKIGARVRRGQPSKSEAQKSVLRMKLMGASATPVITGVDKMPGTAHYLVGRDSSNWHKGISTFRKVHYSGVYPGVDLLFYGNQHELEYDFLVGPGADPKKISLGFEGTKSFSIDTKGDLVIGSGIGNVKLQKPTIYQVENGVHKQIAGSFALRGADSVGVNVGTYNHSEPLIIDPVLAYSTYLGGSSDDGGGSLAVDSLGNAYITGWTDSSDFPIVGTSVTPAPNGNYVAFVAKLNPDGTALVYSTYLGGTGGDYGYGLAIDGSGDAYVTGYTGSSDFPVTPNAFQSSLGSGATSNAFLTKLSADGQSLLYSTYLGGGASDWALSIAVDANQNAYVTGEATSGTPTPFPTTSNAFQSTINSIYGNGFVTRIDTTQTGANSLIYSTFLGGAAPSNGWDSGQGIAVDSNQNVYVDGVASSADFPIISATAYQTTNYSGYTVFLSQIDTTKSGSTGLIYSTFIGGSIGDQATSAALDSSGKVYMTGCSSSGFPTTTGVANSSPGKALVAKFDTTQSQSASLVFSTVVGGSGGECGNNIATDPIGNVYVVGFTRSSDFPVTSDAIQSVFGAGIQDSFVAVLSPDGLRILFGTYLGGSGSYNDFAGGLALDQNYNIYIAGGDDSSGLQTTTGAFQTSLDGSSDAFVAKLTALPIPRISSLSQLSGPNGEQITINGLNFGASQGSSTVTFGTDTAPIVSWSDTAVVAQVPGFSPPSLLLVTVNTSLESSNSEPFVVTTPPPVIFSLSPTSGTPGGLVTISGSGFGATQGQGVNFNGISASIISWSDTSITVTVPIGAMTGNVTVTVSTILTSNGVSFTVPLIITGLSTNAGPVGAAVRIIGTGFGATQGSSAVSFNGTPAMAASWSTSSITVTVPSGATTGNILVTVSGANTNGVAFTVLPRPAITSLSPTSGPVTTSVTITGTGFGSNQGGSTVAFNGASAAITSWSATSIVATVPIGATTGNVVVTLVGVASSGVTFTVTAPTIGAIVVTPANASILVGAALQLKVTGIYVDTTTQDLTSSATWSSTDTTKATISSSGLATAVALGQTTIQASVGSLNGSTTLNVVSSGTMNVARFAQTATLLTSGKILLAGGSGSPNVPESAELYDPSTGIFSLTGSLTTARSNQTATLLNDGTVLIVGGWNGNDFSAAAEVYDPSAGTFMPTGSLSVARSNHTATLLHDGTVLIAGGSSDNGEIAISELYIPATRTFTTNAGPLNTARNSHTATLLNDGSVLIAGGYDGNGNALVSAELYDPATGNFTLTGSLNTGRISHTATLLNGGKVLIAGGRDSNFTTLASAELYDPTLGSFSAAAGMNLTHIYHTATLLNNGTVLIGAGRGGDFFTFSDSEIYDPVANTFTDQGSDHRFNHTATLLNDGSVLFAGGLVFTGDFNIPDAQSSLIRPATLTPSGLVTIAISPTAPSFSVGLTQNFTATGTFSDSSTQVLSSVTWGSSDNTLTTVTNDWTNRGHAYALAAGSPTITACAGSVCGSATPTVAASHLTIMDLFPSFGGAGSVVVIAGTGFGATQGTSTVAFNGATATVASWSSTGIVVTVPSGATTGNVVVTVSSANSNGIAFTVLSSPVITGISPSSGAAGTSVTISGSNFGATSGRAINFNGGAAPITSWTDSSITTSVPSTAITGSLTVTNTAGVTSNGVSFAVPLVITNLSPTSGPASILVTVTGSSFGATQGSSSLSIGSAPLTVVSWSDTQILAAVGTGTTTGTLSVHVGSNTAPGPTFTITSSFPYNVSPRLLNMLVGESRTVSVTNGSGAPLTGLHWITTDPTIVSLSTDDPPVLTAVAAGSATVYAGTVPISVTVNAGSSLPSGTAIWSLPLGGFGELNIVPAVPSSSGTDVFALDSAGTLSAVSVDGNIVWQVPGVVGGLIPDFSGNALLLTPNSYSDGQGNTYYYDVLRRVDQGAGLSAALHTYTGFVYNGSQPTTQVAERAIPDTTGVVFIQDNTVVSVLNPSTGRTLGSVDIEDGNADYDQQGKFVGAIFGNFIVAGDGNAYLPYTYHNETGTNSGGGHIDLQSDTYLKLLRVSPDGTYTKTELHSWHKHINYTPLPDPTGYSGEYVTSSGSDIDYTINGIPANYSVVTNADAGVAVFATVYAEATCDVEYIDLFNPGYSFSEGCPDQTPHELISYVSKDSMTSQMDFTALPHFVPALQREDGSYVGSDTFEVDHIVAAIGPDGSLLWQQPIDANFTTPTPLYATSDGGVIVRSTPLLSGPSTIYTLDQDGNVTSSTSDTGAVSSWTNKWYVDPAGTLMNVSRTVNRLAGTFAAIWGGNQSHNGTSIDQIQTLMGESDAEQAPVSDAPINPFYDSNYNSIELLTSTSVSNIWSNFLLSFAGVTGVNNDIANIVTTLPVESTGTKIGFELMNPFLRLGQGPFYVKVKALDAASYTLSAVTLVGHPLRGRRYFRVFSLGPNDIAIETGAVDEPGPGTKNYIGYYLGRYTQTKVWQEDLEYIQKTLGATRSSLHGYNFVQGDWHYNKNYIWNNICVALACN